VTQTLAKSGDWPVSVVGSLTALWAALDAADMEVSKAVREMSPADLALKQLEEDFEAARHPARRVSPGCACARVG
jgi:hypothetical protein